MPDLTALTLKEAGSLLAQKEISSVELTQAHLDKIEAKEPEIQAYITVTAKEAIAGAEAADKRRAAGDTNPMLGIPLAYKDVLVTKDVQTTAGSQILRGYEPPYTATAIRKLEEAGAVMLGKTNMDEFAMGSSTENSSYQITRNPWDTDYVPGGSSGGSAAAVSAGMALGALGTDTGGSIRQPASLCGVVGLKPTYGRVSRYGLIAFASSLDQCGAFARSVEDAALMLNAISGYDPLDGTSLEITPPDFTAALTGEVKGLRIGVPDEYFIEGIQEEVADHVWAAIKTLEEMGAEVKRISLPHTDMALPVYYLIAPAECSANLARFDGVRYGPRVETGDMLSSYRETRGQGFGPEVTRRVMLGTYALSAGYYDAYYLKAQKVRTLIKSDFDAAFEEVDVIACPTAPTTAFKVGEKTDDPLEMYLSDIFTLAVNLAGITGISLPCGFDSKGLPIGIQLMGPALGEETILRAAHAYECAADWPTLAE